MGSCMNSGGKVLGEDCRAGMSICCESKYT
jgi:hypothetical protein